MVPHLISQRESKPSTEAGRIILMVLCMVLLCMGGGAAPCLAQSNLVEREKRELLSVTRFESLSQSTKEVAVQLEIWPLLKNLYEQKAPLSLAQRLHIRDKILETVIESYLDAASVEAEAQREQGYLQAMRQNLLEHRDKRVEFNNATNFIASGTLNTIGSILQFSPRAQPLPGNMNQMLGGVVSAGMSTYALKQNAGGKTRGQGQPTVLAELFGRPIDERTTYPESVWRFI